MPHPDFPEQQAQGQKRQSGERGKHQQPVARPAKEKEQRIILKQCQGNDIREKFQHAFAVDAEGIPAEFPSSVGKDVHEFQALGGVKTEGGVNHEQPGKDRHAPGNHQHQGQDAIPPPHDTAGGDDIGEHQHRLEKAAQTGQFHLGGQHLKHRAPGPYQNTVELAVAEHGGEGVKAPRKAFGQGKGHQDDGEAEQHLLIGEALHRVKAGEHKINSEKHGEGNQELPENGQEE